MIINYLYFLILSNIDLHLQSIHKERFLPSLYRSNDTDRSCFYSSPVYRSDFLMILRMLIPLILKNEQYCRYRCLNILHLVSKATQSMISRSESFPSYQHL